MRRVLAAVAPLLLGGCVIRNELFGPWDIATQTVSTAAGAEHSVEDGGFVDFQQGEAVHAFGWLYLPGDQAFIALLDPPLARGHASSTDLDQDPTVTLVYGGRDLLFTVEQGDVFDELVLTSPDIDWGGGEGDTLEVVLSR